MGMRFVEKKKKKLQIFPTTAAYFSSATWGFFGKAFWLLEKDKKKMHLSLEMMLFK